MKKEKLGILFVLIAGTLWGTMGVFVNFFDSEGLTSVDIAGIRLVFSALIMAVYLLIKNPKLFIIKMSDVWCFMGSGLVSLMIFTVCYFKTIVLSSMSVAAVLLYTSPVFVILFSFFLFKEKITRIKALSCIICVAGCAFVTGIIGSDTRIPLIAFLLGISSGIAYALYSIFSRFALQKGYSSLTITTYTFIFATIGLIPFTDFPTIGKIMLQKPELGVIMALTGLITAVLPYIFYTSGLERLESGKAAVIAAIEPVVATIIGGIFFKDNLSILQYFGIVLVIFSIVLTNIKINKSKEK